jgi:hypothetical protein
MIRLCTIILVMAGFITMMMSWWLKEQVNRKQQHLTLLQKNIAQKTESLHMLQAEWAFLTQPNYLASLSAGNLPLKPIEGQQVEPLLPFGMPVSHLVDLDQ